MAQANPTPLPEEQRQQDEEQPEPTLAELCERAEELDELVRRHLAALHGRKP